MTSPSPACGRGHASRGHGPWPWSWLDWEFGAENPHPVADVFRESVGGGEEEEFVAEMGLVLGLVGGSGHNIDGG